MTQQGSIDAQKFAQKYGLSSVEVITKIKNKEIKGFSKCSGSMIPDTNVGGNIATINEVSDDQKATFFFS